MVFIPASGRAPTRALTAAISATLLALLVVAVPVGAHSVPIHLAQAKASAVVSTAGEPVSFQVRYRHSDDVAPDSVWVEIAGRDHPMQADGDGSWSRGVRFTVVVYELPAGKHAVAFHAQAGDDRAKLKWRVVTVKAVPEPATGDTPAPDGGGNGSGSGADGGAGSDAGSGGSGDTGQTGSDAGSGSGGTGGTGETGDAGSGSTGASGGSGSGSGAASGSDSGTSAGNDGGGGLDSGASGNGGTGGGSGSGTGGSTTVGTGIGAGDSPSVGTGDSSATGASDGGSGGGSGGDAGSEGNSLRSDSAPLDGSSLGWSLGDVDGSAGGDSPMPPPDREAADARVVGSRGGFALHPWLNGVASAGLPIELGGPDLAPHARILAVTMTTTGVVVMTFAFGFFAKRRRDGDPTDPDEVLQARSARAGSFATATLVPAASLADSGPSWPMPESGDPDGHLPRWRRPSVQEARKADPSRMEQIHVAMTFTGSQPSGGSAVAAVAGGVAPVDGLERRRIRYRLVRLLDGPDELRAGELGYLDEGDEVQLVAQSGSYWLVHCPNGQQGWIHRMTLGDVVQADGPARPASSSPNSEEVDGDVLAAFLSRRASN